MAAENEKFLSRWSRLKRESDNRAKETSDDKALEAPPAALPPVAELTPESDFTGFMHPKVEDALRRVALKKLFGDPHFNIPDPFEPFSGDWTGGDPIPDEMLATLNQARTLLFDKKEDKEAGTPEARADADPRPEPEAHPTNANPDEPGRKDA